MVAIPSTTIHPRQRFFLLSSFCLLILSELPTSCQGQLDTTTTNTNSYGHSCGWLDPTNTFCPTPQPWQWDGICEATRQDGMCTDCWDCDPCHLHKYDCSACLEAGCYWCPGDALCSSIVVTQDMWDFVQDIMEWERDELQPSCIQPADWLTDRCHAVDGVDEEETPLSMDMNETTTNNNITDINNTTNMNTTDIEDPSNNMTDIDDSTTEMNMTDMDDSATNMTEIDDATTDMNMTDTDDPSNPIAVDASSNNMTDIDDSSMNMTDVEDPTTDLNMTEVFASSNVMTDVNDTTANMSMTKADTSSMNMTGVDDPLNMTDVDGSVTWNSTNPADELDNITTTILPHEMENASTTIGPESTNTTNATSNNVNINTTNVFSDPLYDAMQWIYDMIAIEPVWRQGITGQGIHVRVNDIDGVDASHLEFEGRFDVEHSCEQYLPPDVDPTTTVQFQHGTAVASLAVGGGNNDQCAVGMAPDATFSACLLPPVGSPLVFGTTMILHLPVMDVSVNSWSLDACVPLPTEQRRRKLQNNTATCPFSTEYRTSPCTICGASILGPVAHANLASLSTACQQAIAFHCTTRFEDDVAACSEFLALYAECDYDPSLAEEERAALEVGVQQGRDGKGVIFVVSAGNFYTTGDSTNHQKWVNTRYTISVGAVDKSGMHASYSTTGSSLFISAPGGDLNHLSNNIVAQVGGGCHDIGPGTSFSGPVAAGVMALLLQANPELTWRDVQGILAETSQQFDPDDASWVINAAGYHHSYKFGFGVIHAANAVAAAESWVNWTPEKRLFVESPIVNLAIPESVKENTTVAPAKTVLTVDQGTLEDFQIESVVVFLEIDHPSRGDLSVVLTSPQGTESILHTSPRPENAHLGTSTFWELMTVRSWGESPAGNWTLTIRDEKPGQLETECVDIPWLYVLDATPEVPNGARVTCGSIRRTNTCADGAPVNPDIVLLPDAETSLTPDKACCVCGGGTKPTSNSHLVSWKLVVYGRGKAEDATEEQLDDEGVEVVIENVTAPPANTSVPSSDGDSGGVTEGITTPGGGIPTPGGGAPNDSPDDSSSSNAKKVLMGVLVVVGATMLLVG